MMYAKNPDSLDCTLHRAPAPGEWWRCVSGPLEGTQRMVEAILYSTKGRAARVLWARDATMEFFTSWKRLSSIDDVVYRG